MADVPEIECARCGRTAAPPADVPYGGELGEEIRSRTCAACWDEWLAAEVMVINELRLNFMDPKSQDVLTRHLREFLALDAGSGN
jgi:Fe-S cluster biosynthesis and repair protein YggX